MKPLSFVLLALCASAWASSRPKPAPRPVDRDYALALATADRVLGAWLEKDRSRGLSLLSPALREGGSDPDAFFLERPDEPHDGFEIGAGERLSDGRYSFPVRLFCAVSSAAWTQPPPKRRHLLIIRSWSGLWLAGRLP